MNERIKELAEQAKGFVDLNQHVGGEKGCMVYTYDGLEKFAELIIRRCADRATWAQDTNEDDIGGEVLKHFGIKEHYGIK